MSVHWDEIGQRYVVRFRDADGRNRAVTVSAKNLTMYGLRVPDRISQRVARRLKQAILARETAADGSMRSINRRQLLWLEVVARYLPPLFDEAGRDTWEARPAGQRLENERTYSRNQLDRMQRVLTSYFPSYLEHGRIRWQRRGRRRHNRADTVYVCTRRTGSISREQVVGFQIYLSAEAGMSPATVRGYMAKLKTFMLWCYKRDYILNNPAADLKPPSEKKREVLWLDDKQANELRKAVKGHQLKGPVRTILGLGLRRSEMMSLQWRDINFEAAIVRVRGTKTDRALREIPRSKMSARYFRTLQRSKDNPNVVLNTNGRPWNRSSLNSAVRRFRAAGRRLARA